MAPAAVTPPVLLTDPGYLFIAPLLSTIPVNTVAGSVFTDAWNAAFLPLGPTEDGSTLQYQTNIEAITAAEFFDANKYVTTSRAGSFAFNMMSFTLSNYARALNKGAAALAPTSGAGATALGTLTPPTPGAEVRVMLGWESQDNTMRLVIPQCIQGGQITSAFKKAPSTALIPATFNFEVPSAGGAPFTLNSAGATRLGT
jgi:hypothetical protein